MTIDKAKKPTEEFREELFKRTPYSSFSPELQLALSIRRVGELDWDFESVSFAGVKLKHWTVSSKGELAIVEKFFVWEEVEKLLLEGVWLK